MDKMNIKIYTIGKIRNDNILNEINRINKRINLDIVVLKDFKDKNIDIIRKKEFNEIKKKVKENIKILLWEHGEEFSTDDFFDKVYEKVKIEDICFILTGPFGPSEELKKICFKTLSLSKMTFTHEMALLLLVEQLYRCYSIENNIPYHK